MRTLLAAAIGFSVGYFLIDGVWAGLFFSLVSCLIYWIYRIVTGFWDSF